jgi:hypothetical protein
MIQFREFIDPLLEVYAKFRAGAAKYGTEVFPHIVLLAQAFYAHTSIVKVCRYEFHFSYS